MRLKNLGNLLEVNVYSQDYNNNNTEALLISNEEYSGYLTNNPDNAANIVHAVSTY
jgi:hypothetical protein